MAEVQPLSVNTFRNLDQLHSPVCYGEESKIPSPSIGTPGVPQGLNIKGRISQGCQFGYSYNCQVIRCFPISLNPGLTPNLTLGRSDRVPSAISSVGYHFPGAVITCDAELKIQTQRAIRKLLLGLDYGRSGALVIFDPIRAKPLKWINLPAPVTSVTVLSHFESEGSSRPFLSEAMMAMVGVAAVGLNGGRVLLVDLGLDNIETDETGYLDQQADIVFNIYNVEPHEDYIVPKRKNAMSKKLMICLEFNYQQPQSIHEDHLFYYCDQFGDKLGKLDKSQVRISCLEYVPQIESIVVGYNFGGFQIWKLESLELEYSSPFHPEGLSVCAFAFQQPIDDPKSYCYLWVLYGTLSAELSPSRVELHALVYAEQPNMEHGHAGSVYVDFQDCKKKLSFHLQDCYPATEPDPDEPSETTPLRFLVRPLRMWTQAECLLFISWESSRDGVSYLGIFDLNQWYSAQTPDSFVLSGDTRLNSFWCAVSYKNQNSYSQIWDIRIIPKTFEKWINPHMRDSVHLYPASITFQAVCLSSTGVFSFEHFGIQEKLFRLIQKEGYIMMTEPALLRDLCQVVGLSTYYSPDYDDPFSQVELDQMFVLTVLLESRRPQIIVQFASKWLDGSFENLGCSLSLILKWAVTVATTIRIAAIPHWDLILSHVVDDLPPETIQFIHYSNFIWTQLKALLWMILRQLSIAEQEEYSDFNFSLEKLVQYSGAVLMLNRAQVLPVSPEYMFMDHLKTHYEERRKSVRAAFDTCPYLQPEERLGHPLLIDYLFENLDENFLREEWNTGIGEPFYPPRDPGLIINLFLGSWLHVPSKIINRIVFYFLLDLMRTPENRIDLRGDFSSIISLSGEEQTQVAVLWMIDHCEFRGALSRLPVIHLDDEKDGLPWSAAMVILAAQGFEKPVFNILRGISFPRKIGGFVLRLACDLEPDRTNTAGSIISAFAADEDLVHRLLQIAESKQILDKLLSSTLSHCSEAVEVAVTKFYQALLPTIENCIRLLNFYIGKDRFEDAVELYKIMLREFGDRKVLSPGQLRAWQTAEVSLRNRMRTSRVRFGDRSPGVQRPKLAAVPHGKPITIRAQEVPKTPESGLVTSGLLALPPQIRRLMKDGMETRAGQTPFSPLRRYSGRLHRHSTTSDELSNGKAKNKVVPVPFLVSSPEGPARRTHNLVVDFHTLLKSPKVTHGKLSDDEYKTSPELFGTPSTGLRSASSAESATKSIMKNNDQSLRKHVLLKKARFLNIPGSTSDEDEEAKVSGKEVSGETRTPAPAVSPSPVLQDVIQDPDHSAATTEDSDEMQGDDSYIDACADKNNDMEISFDDASIEVVNERDKSPDRSPSPEAVFQNLEEQMKPVGEIVESEEGNTGSFDVSVVPPETAADSNVDVELDAEVRLELAEVQLEVAEVQLGVVQVQLEVASVHSRSPTPERPSNIEEQEIDIPEVNEGIETGKTVTEPENVDSTSNENKDDVFEITVFPLKKRQRSSSSRSMKSPSPKVQDIVVPARSRSVPKNIDYNVFNETRLETPPPSRRIPRNRSVSKQRDDDEVSIVQANVEVPKDVAPGPTRSSSSSQERPPNIENQEIPEVCGEPVETADEHESRLDPSADETIDEFIEATGEIALKRRRRSNSSRTTPPLTIKSIPARSRSEPKNIYYNTFNETMLSTPPSFKRTTRRMSRQLEDDEVSIADDTLVNESSEDSSLAVGVTPRSKRASRPKKSPPPSVPGPSTSTSIGTRSMSRKSINLNESMVQTPPYYRRSTRSMSRHLEDVDLSLTDESVNTSANDTVLETSVNTPMKRAVRAKKSPSSTPRKGGRATSEPRASTSWSIFDQTLLAGAEALTKPMTRNMSRLLEQSADANSSSDGSILEASIEEPKKRTSSRKRERAQSEPKGTSRKSLKRVKVSSNPNPVDVDSEDEEARSSLPKKILRNFPQYETNLSTVLEDSESSSINR